MKLNPTPRRLLQLDALFIGRGPARGLREAREPVFEDARLPDEAEAASQRLASVRLGRVAAEVALEEGGQRQYAPRREAEVLEFRARP
ncbi:hypothetical protein [Roseateles saccharophilus]|uniref:Uncharacterized protein n=1 Tax=Roseateles saccharophilus TaxID=304 RepID=A0A4R3V2A8_ROSSA|nr:hypothetical protein [Roseateles saccharophilus]MDG0832004.1 hypothetical protein [Roseateles saccharophilus]TCU97328.1 hypothetical protein EV671_10111 [Roseateles saccharophilus]